ncbi:hypothetical protein PMAYCL1PPCAC_08067, partial [Pristionchus mayeri]
IFVFQIFSSVVCSMDTFYMVMTPLTSRGGGWVATLYEPWNIYADVDYRYTYSKDLVTMVNGRIMIVEIVMNIVAVIMNKRRSRHTLITAFTTSALVFWKTVFYFVLYIGQPEGTPPYLNPEASILRLLFIFWIPGGLWVVIPLLVMVTLWNRLAKNEY